jgi:predicted nucleic acid-binding protein
MDYFVDTSVAVRQTDRQSIDHPVAVNALAVLRSRRDRLHIISQNVIEFWAVATRPLSVNGLGLSTHDAETERALLEAAFILLPDPPGLYTRWVELVNTYGISGKPTHDARIVAAMMELGITHILTFNVTDFARFAPRIIAVHPRNV